MRHGFIALIATLLLPGAAQAQSLGFDDFTWTFDAPASASGSVTSSVLHVTGPSGSACSNELAVFTTTAPFAGTVHAHLDWTILDICHYDWPVRIVNGQYTKIPVAGDTSCFTPGACEVDFTVQAGDVFGFGVGSTDCEPGPGLADFTQFSFLPPTWIDVGGALDPRLELEIAGPAGFKEFGSEIASVGDLDGDGETDLAVTGSVGYPQDQVVSARSGADGSELWSSSGPTGYGDTLVPAADVNGDGLPDLAVSDRVQSRVHMLSGADGATLWTWIWPGSSLDAFSAGLTAFADVNGDGVIDIAVGSPKSPALPVRVLSGATGVALDKFVPGPGDTSFGAVLGAPGDLDGDGVGELMVGAMGSPPRLRVYSGATKAQLFELHSPSVAAVAWKNMNPVAAGDWDGDGVPDIAVGDSLDILSPATGGIGSVSIFSGATGELLSWLKAPAAVFTFGAELAGGVDVDGDGDSDLAIGAPDVVGPAGLQGGRVRIVAGPDGALLQEFASKVKIHLGRALAWQAGASQPTLAIGLPAEMVDGSVRLYSDLLHPGAPLLSMYGAMVAGTPWTLSVEQGPPGNFAFLVAGLSAASAPFKGGVLVPAPDVLLPMLLDGTGGFEIATTAPAGVASLQIWLQAWISDAAGPHGWSATRALKSPSP